MDESSQTSKTCLNILIFAHSSQLAGAERSLIQLVKELIEDYNAACTVVLPSNGPAETYLQEVGASTIILSLNWWCTIDDFPDHDEINKRYRNSFESLLKNLEIFQKIDPDVILTNTLVIPWGAVTALLLKLPHVWMVNEFGILDTDLNFFLPFNQILNIIHDVSNSIITRSNAIKKQLFPHNDNKVQTIYRDIEIPGASNLKSIIDDKYFHDPDAFHLIIASTIIEPKGQEDAVRSMVELIKNRKRRVELLIVGYTPTDYNNFLQNIIDQERLNDYVQIIPFQENIFPILNLADAILVCSKMEAFGRIILEGMLLKKVVIATNTGGTPEMITDSETGFLYPPGDHVQLADIIENLMDNTELQTEIINNAYAFATKTFTRERYGGEYYKLLMALKEKSPGERSCSYAYLVDQYQNLLNQKYSEVKILSETVQKAEQEIFDYENSISWRLTRPFREIKNLIQRKS